MKAGCGKTARPVWAADGGKPKNGASSDPTVMKRPKGRGAKGLRHPVGLICQPARGGACEFGKSFYYTKGTYLGSLQ